MAFSNAKSPEINKFKALIVEDNTFFRSTFKEALQRLFPSVVIQEAAEESKALQKSRYVPSCFHLYGLM